MSHHIIEFNHIGFTYPDGNRVLTDLSLNIHHGESVAIIGANGAGKSTLLHLLAGIFLPQQGQISIGHIPVIKKNLRRIREKLGFAFQNPDDQLFMTSVYEDIAFGPRNFGLEADEVSLRVMNALDRVGIVHLKDRAPYKLSGGEKRAASIAVILAMEPDILVMDEPTAALDPRSRRRFISLIKEFSHTKIIASHDLDMVLELCERTIVLHQGNVIADGGSSQILSDISLMESCGLERPLTLQNCLICREKKNHPKDSPHSRDQ